MNKNYTVKNTSNLKFSRFDDITSRIQVTDPWYTSPKLINEASTPDTAVLGH